MGKLYSLRLPPAIEKSDNFVRLGYIHLHLFLSRNRCSSDIMQAKIRTKHIITYIVTLHFWWLCAISFNQLHKNPTVIPCELQTRCVLPATARLAFHKLPAPVQHAATPCLRLFELMQLKKKKARPPDSPTLSFTLSFYIKYQCLGENE